MGHNISHALAYFTNPEGIYFIKKHPEGCFFCIFARLIIQGCKDNDSFALGKLGKKYNQNMPLENQNNYAYNYCSPNTVITNEGGKDDGIT
jgi:hypothetical protein